VTSHAPASLKFGPENEIPFFYISFIPTFTMFSAVEKVNTIEQGCQSISNSMDTYTWINFLRQLSYLLDK
jgi:hypothetical protein